MYEYVYVCVCMCVFVYLCSLVCVCCSFHLCGDGGDSSILHDRTGHTPPPVVNSEPEHKYVGDH